LFFRKKLELHKLIFIPVVNGTRLVSVKSLFARLTINLSPFGFELPIQYLPLFVALLREIGTQEALQTLMQGNFFWISKRHVATTA
jgi:sacsin